LRPFLRGTVAGDDGAHDLEAFARDFRAAAQRAGLTILEFTDTYARIEYDGRRSRLGTRPLLQRWRALPPERREDFLDEILTGPLEDIYPGSENTFHEVRPSLMPRLGPPDVMQDTGLPFAPPSRPLVEGLVHVFLVVDEPATMWFVTDQHLERWGMTFAEVEAQAVENLRRRTDPGHVERDPDFPVAQYVTHDSYDASRMLVVEEAVGPVGPQGLVAAVPTKDHFFFAPVAGPATRQLLEFLLRIVWKVYPEAAYPVTDQLLWYDGHIWWPVRWTREDGAVSMKVPEGLHVTLGEGQTPPEPPP
jgi:hypothetical protein